MRHYNPSITERLFRIFRPKAGDQFSDEVSPNLVAVVPITPVCRIIKAAGSSATGTMNVWTTPTDKDFYLTGANLSMVKDAANDMATGNVSLAVFVDGVAVNPIGIALLTLTAQNQTVQANFSIPIKLDRGSVISVGATYAAGAMRRFVTINGYTEEVITT